MSLDFTLNISFFLPVASSRHLLLLFMQVSYDNCGHQPYQVMYIPSVSGSITSVLFSEKGLFALCPIPDLEEGMILI